MLTLGKYRTKLILPLVLGLSMITGKVQGQISDTLGIQTESPYKTLPQQDKLLLQKNLGKDIGNKENINKINIIKKISEIYDIEQKKIIQFLNTQNIKTRPPLEGLPLEVVFDKDFPAGMHKNDTIFINGHIYSSDQGKISWIIKHEFIHASNFHKRIINKNLYTRFPIDSCKNNANLNLNNFLQQKNNNSEHIPDDEHFKNIVQYTFREEEFFVKSFVLRDYILKDISLPGTYNIDYTIIQSLINDKYTPEKELIIFIKGYEKEFLKYIFSIVPFQNKYLCEKTSSGRNIIIQ